MKSISRFLTMVLIAAAEIVAQTDTVTANATDAPRGVPVVQLGDPNTNLPWLPVGPGDLIAVTVADCPEMTRGFRIAADGTIDLPLLQDKLHIAGLKPPEIELVLAKAVKEQHILVHPIVSVSIMDYRSRPVNVVGAVRLPVSFQAFGDLRLTDALAKAQGLTPEAGPEILVTSPVTGAVGARSSVTRRIRVRDLLHGSDPSLNILLVGGEEIRVPEADKVYVVGNVKMPGAIPVHDDTETTLLKILAQCQGLAPYATSEAFIYRVKAGTKDREEIPVPLKKIVQRKASDVTLLPNDVVYIPDAVGKRLTLSALARIGELGGYTVSGMAIWSRF